MSLVLDQLREKIFSKFHKDTWEIRTIEEIAEKVYIGNEISKEQLGTGTYPAIKCGDITSGKLNLSFEKCISFVDINLIKTKKFFGYGDLLVANFSDSKKVGTASVYLGKEKCLAGKGVTVVKHNQNPKFLSYIWSTKFVREQIVKSSLQGTVLNFWSEKVKQIKVPLPSLEIQQEIVEFLDKFNELERELEMRKKQYEYYKNNSVNNGIEKLKWEIKSIGEISIDIFNGIEVTRAQLGTGNHPAIKCGDINSSLPQQFEECISFVDPKLIKKHKYFKRGDVLISKMSNKVSTVGTAATYLGTSECLLGGDIDAIRHNQNPKYLVYVLSTSFARKQIENLAQESTVFHLYTKYIRKIKIPVPSLEEQTRLVEKIDKFYKITHSFKEGIPLLIRKNREQYEFYKELLLER